MCSIVSWMYNRGGGREAEDKVQDGKVKDDSPQSTRLSVDNKCSLVIRNITDEDAGHYTCRPGAGGPLDEFVYLSILTILTSSPNADPAHYGNVTLQCTLWRYNELGACPENSLLWVDEAGSKLLGEDVGYRFERHIGCDSYLTVKLQSSSNRRYTCQFVEENRVKIEAHYPSVFTDPVHNNSLIIVGPVIGGMVLLVIIVVVLIKFTRRTRVTKDQEYNTDVENPTRQIHQYDEAHANQTYATIKHHNPNALHKKMLKEEEELVTYSAVRTNMKTEADIDPCGLYSFIDKPE
ncbi:hypothetical protein CRENBAI_000669 [Crenichthys baileyi]|uniref:Ig-like domain-containing protein n=1 Tax=Crenichthys baileyi TaxID=28760 RepID=A0AAV9R5M5_9TELE